MIYYNNLHVNIYLKKESLKELFNNHKTLNNIFLEKINLK